MRDFVPFARNRAKLPITAAVAAVAAMQADSLAVLSFNVDANGWPSVAHRDAAVNAMQSVVNRYNAYGDFGNYNVYVYYNAGIPTAQANYLGSIGFGGTYPNERVTMHELAHYLGSGTYGDPWDGARGEAIVDQFDGLEATLQGDTQHFWPYGLNYDSEGSEINKQRQVALVYAQRADLGVGSTANPSSATVVNMTASDAVNESGFNYANTWSNTHFAQSGAAYTTGQFTLRTPASANSFTFVGDSLTVNNTNGINGGLLYKGSGTTGVTTFKNLNLNGGYVRHASSLSDTFQINGKITLTGSPTIDAAQGNINISAGITGTGSLTKAGSFTLTLSGGNNYTGSTIISAGKLKLAPNNAIANYTFDSVSGNTVVNAGSGGAAMNGTLANGASIVGGGRFGNAVSLSGGGSVDINSPITDLSNQATWTVSAWVKTAVAGSSILTKSDGTNWGSGNTVFYLGDGTAGGSGGLPSAVRYAGGFFQAAAGTTAVNNNLWHQVTYVSNKGLYYIYVDGVLQSLSSGNAGFANADVGSIVRLGISTNTFAGDGANNFNGLMDSVQFYPTALSDAQIAAMFQGLSLGPLPLATDVSIASGATLDVNGITQQIGSLSGVVGSIVTLGSGQLIVSSPSVNTQFSGAMSGTGGSLVKSGNSTLTLSGTNTYTGNTTITGGKLAITGTHNQNAAYTVTGAGILEIAAGGTLGISTINSNTTIANNGTLGTSAGGNVNAIAGTGTTNITGGTLNSALAIRQGTLNLTNGSTASIAANGTATGVSTLNALSIDSASKLDIHDNDLVVTYSAGQGATVYADLVNKIKSGLISLGGSGTGITSTEVNTNTLPGTTLGILDNATAGLTSVSGYAISSPNSSIIIKYTWIGDANLDGVVDGTDYALIDSGFASSGNTWGQGDLNYSGSVDGTDYALIDSGFGSQSGALPEPTALSILGLGAMAMLRRRRAS